MPFLRVILILAIFLNGGIAVSHADVRSFEKLTLNEKMALEESQRRLAIYDQDLAALDRKLDKHQISKAYYETGTQQLTLVIREETIYQNAILVHDPELPQKAKDLFETFGHVAIAVPVGIAYGVAYVVGKCPQSLGMLAAIH